MPPSIARAAAFVPETRTCFGIKLARKAEPFCLPPSIASTGNFVSEVKDVSALLFA